MARTLAPLFILYREFGGIDFWLSRINFWLSTLQVEPHKLYESPLRFLENKNNSFLPSSSFPFFIDLKCFSKEEL